MSVFDMRQWFESLVPWWTPFAVVAAVVAMFEVYEFIHRAED